MSQCTLAGIAYPDDAVRFIELPRTSGSANAKRQFMSEAGDDTETIAARRGIIENSGEG